MKELGGFCNLNWKMFRTSSRGENLKYQINETSRYELPSPLRVHYLMKGSSKELPVFIYNRCSVTEHEVSKSHVLYRTTPM